MEKICLSVPEMARALGVSKTTAYQLARSQGFPSITIGNRLLVHRAGLEEWLIAQSKKEDSKL